MTTFIVSETEAEAEEYTKWDENRRKSNRWKNILSNSRKALSEHAIEGVSAADLRRIFVEQRCRCTNCGVHDYDSRLHADHCHRTGRLRTFLCETCNYHLHANNGLTRSKWEKLRRMEGRRFNDERPVCRHFKRLETIYSGRRAVRKRLHEVKVTGRAKVRTEWRGRDQVAFVKRTLDTISPSPVDQFTEL